MQANLVVIAAGRPDNSLDHRLVNGSKNRINIRGRSLLLRSVDALERDFEGINLILFETDENLLEIRKELKPILNKLNIINLKHQTKGALCSALMAIDNLDKSQEVIIASGDAIIVGGLDKHVMELRNQGVEGGAIAFESDLPRWSYVRIDSNNNVIELTEKEVVSTIATTGVFYFKSSAEFIKAATWTMINSPGIRGTYFTSEALNYLIFTGQRVGYALCDKHDYIPMANESDLRTLENLLP